MFWIKEKSLQLRVAYVISRIFEPFLWLAIFGVMLVFLDDFKGYNRWWWAIGLATWLGILPILAMWLGIKKGKVADIDFTKKEERTPYILVILLFWFLGLIVAWALGGPKLVLSVLLTLIIVGVIVLIINFLWKVSVHTLGITAGCFFVNELFSGWHYWWLFLAVLIVGWSRWIQKKHTVWQLTGGAGLGVIAWGILRGLGY